VLHDVGRYRVTRRIGQGGMAEVFEAVAAGPDGFERRVAVKRLLATHAHTPAFGRMFFDEAKIASRLHHAHIAAILDYGVDEAGHPFQVLELVDGVDVGRLVALGADAGAPLPVELALSICTDIAHALEHAHGAVDADGRSLGIVHRDVSPANILVSWSGDVKLTDFGIAFARGRLETTSVGVAKGTLLYMAPEQMMRGEVDGRTDVFALGCVLHSLVAGASPLAGESTMADLIAGAPLGLAPGLPADVREIVARATRLLRTERYASAGEMAGALGTALARRIATDPRSVMREWLTRLRPRTDAVGRLDALLGVGLVFSGVRATAGAQPTGTGGIERPARRRFYRLQVAAALLPVAIGIGALAMWPRAEGGRGDGGGIGDGGGGGDGGGIGDGGGGGGLGREIDAAVVAAAVVDAGVASAPRGHRPPPVRPPAPSGTGVVAVGGDGALRAEIIVDGESRGYAPKVLELAVGAHKVVLILPGGRQVERSVAVLPTHTPSAPLRVMVK
jgi:serine/threonine-protein kinase